ncbi:MAG: hypothetical protein QF376_03920 [Anaerolineales bacterium]|nr:hypothetical protein [Anaerolineales bacterium]HJO32672.1 hypothetical protein [Anaerolineales bacterium]
MLQYNFGKPTASRQHIDADRLPAAPDCGLAMLPRETALAKVQHLCAVARAVD